MTKPGIQTTEFWVHNLFQLLNVVLILLHQVSPQTAAYVSAAVASVYIVARAITKYGATPAPDDDTDVTAAPGGTLASPPADASTTIKTLSLLPLAVGLALLLAVMSGAGGCAKSETNRAAQGMIAVQTHASNFDDLINSGAINDAGTAHAGQAIIHKEQTAVDAYFTAIRAGDSEGLAEAKAALATAKQEFLDYLAQHHLTLPQATPITLPALPAGQPTTSPATLPH